MDMREPIDRAVAAPVAHEWHLPAPFACELGGTLAHATLRFTTYGTLSAARDNVAWVLHPLTCDAQPSAWWPGLMGPGRALDPARDFIVCANTLGSCYGSTGPASIDAATGRPYGRAFPPVTIKDMVAAHVLLRRHLGIERIRLGIGGSFGGQQLYEWLATEPGVFDQACVVGATDRQSPWAIAFHESQRMALEADPGFGTPGGGAAGLAAARSIALLSYRSAATYAATQAEADDAVTDGFRAAGYQRHAGRRFTERFDACAYWTLTKAMDSHNVARGRASRAAALGAVRARVLLLALEGDVLFPPATVFEPAALLRDARCVQVACDYGHDSILTHAGEISAAVVAFAAEGEGR